MAITISKSRLTLILVSILTVVVAAVAVGTAVFLQQQNVGPSKSKAATANCPACQAIADNVTAGERECTDAQKNPDGSWKADHTWCSLLAGWIAQLDQCNASCPVGSTPLPTPGGGLADCNGATSGVLMFGTGTTLRIVNCNSSNVTVSCTKTSYTCPLTSGNPGGNGSCSVSQTGSSTSSFTVSGQNISDQNSGTCSPSCGSCQADLACSGDGTSGTVGYFGQATASCTVTTTTAPPASTTAVVTNTPTVTPTSVIFTPASSPTITPTVNPSASPTATPTATPTLTPSATPTLPNTGIMDEVVLPTIAGISLIAIAVYIGLIRNKKVA